MKTSERPESLKRPHWSASRFMLFEQCPKLYRDRYIDGVASDPSLAMLFGHTVHTALEAMHQGHRGTRLAADGGEDRYGVARLVYTAGFDEMAQRLTELALVAPASLYLEGLRMLDQVSRLELNSDGYSEPERWFTLPTRETWGMPTVGAIDLWSPPWSKHGAVVFDFKTTVGSWSVERAAKERWQPMLYSWSYRRAYDVIPTFRYVVLSRLDGSLKTFDRTWSKREWNDDMSQLQFHAEEIAESVAKGRFSCSRGHGTCLECGKPYGHDHVCQEGSRPAKIKVSKRTRAVTGLDGTTWVQPALNLG